MSDRGSLHGLLAGREVPRADASATQAWFRAIAEELLLARQLVIAGQAHELCEVEFYLHGEGHPDPFTHNDALQRTCARWYFHRAGESYRGGTYKGLDISFGGEEEYGGILIRSLRTPDGAIINGSSLCVEHMLSQTGHASVASLDARLDARAVDDDTGPLALAPRARVSDAPMWSSARVGLTLKRAKDHPAMVHYITRAYRFLTAARQTPKGRVNLVIALHQGGLSIDEIVETCGTTKASVKRYLAAYAEGLSMDSSVPLWGQALNGAAICRLHGVLSKVSAAGAPDPLS